MARGREQRSAPLLCVDFGTSSIKAGLIDDRGKLGEWTHDSLFDYPGADLGAWHPSIWLEGLRNVTSRLASAAGARAVVISGNGPTLVPVDADGDTVGDALLWIDRREHRRGAGASFFLPKAAWLMRNAPEIYDRTASFLSFPEYINYVLTGRQAAIVPSEAFVPYYWLPSEIEAYGLEREKFAPFIHIGTRIGNVTEHGSERTGVPAGLPVIAGGSDFLMALVGTAAVVPGRTCDRAGTSEGINYCAAAPVTSERVRCLPHAVPGLYNAAGILGSTGRVFEWFRSISGQTNRSYREMVQEILSIGHDADTPYFFPSLRVAETWEFSDAVFSRLSPVHGRAEMGRAVVESIGFAVRDLIEALEAGGCKIDSLRACGGQARNPLWNQMKADITGKEIVVPEIVDAELAGDACAGLVGLGEHASLAEAAHSLVRIEQSFSPSASEHERFSDAFRKYLERRDRIVSVVASLDEDERSRGTVD